MILTSPNFKNNAKMPVIFTRDGENINPELEIKNIPENAKSLILIFCASTSKSIALSSVTAVNLIGFSKIVKTMPFFSKSRRMR